MISKPRARQQNTACSDIHCACIWCVGVRTGSSGQVYQLTACVASVQILLCTPQNFLCCSSIIFPKHWSIRKPIILLLHKCHTNRILYAFFHSARCFGLIYTAVCAEKMFLIFLGVSLGTLLLLSHSTSVYTKFQLHPKNLQQLFLKVLYKGSRM